MVGFRVPTGCLYVLFSVIALLLCKDQILRWTEELEEVRSQSVAWPSGEFSNNPSLDASGVSTRKPMTRKLAQLSIDSSIDPSCRVNGPFKKSKISASHWCKPHRPAADAHKAEMLKREKQARSCLYHVSFPWQSMLKKGLKSIKRETRMSRERAILKFLNCRGRRRKG